jgi:hypothetical protein
MKTLPKDPSPILDLIIKSESEIAFRVGLFLKGVLCLGESLDGMEMVYGLRSSQTFPMLKYYRNYNFYHEVDYQRINYYSKSCWYSC